MRIRTLHWSAHWVGRAGAPRFLTAIFPLLVVLGCGDYDQSPPKLGVQNWQPDGIGGPLEVRPLPAADRVNSDYDAWLGEGTARIGRLYETTIHGSNQFQFSFSVSGGDTALGYSVGTEASFLYRDQARGEYELFYSHRGRHRLDFMKLGSHSKVVWLRPNGQTNASGAPQLKILAFEGLEPDWGVWAEPGTKTN
jgi:hypothetical protein